MFCVRFEDSDTFLKRVDSANRLVVAELMRGATLQLVTKLDKLLEIKQRGDVSSSSGSDHSTPNRVPFLTSDIGRQEDGGIFDSVPSDRKSAPPLS